MVDLKDGPWVVELPPGPYIALAMDRHQRWVLDMGLPGPDEGNCLPSYLRAGAIGVRRLMEAR